MNELKELLLNFKAWLLHEDRKKKAEEVREKLEKAFTEHPEAAGETYLVHLWFTAKMAAHFFYISLAIFIHGLLPFTFTTTASREIEKVTNAMKARKPKADITSAGGSI